MSIRLRLTLLYTAILALTLIVFSTILYAIQSQSTLNMIEQDLMKSAGPLVGAWARFHSDWGRGSPQPPPWPNPEDRTYRDEAQRVLQPVVREEVGRDAVHILDAQGTPLELQINEQSDALPISQEGLTELQSGSAWMEVSHDDEDARWLIYNIPVLTDDEMIGIVQLARSLEDRDRSLRSLGWTLTIGSLSTTLIAFGIGWLLAGTTLRPIHRITQTAQRIGESRDFTSRVDYKGPKDELGRLAMTFNGMLARLQDAYQQVAHALQMQRDFVADVSHELRTPLTTIRGNLALLRRQPSLPAEEQDDILADLTEESERMTRLVTDLLVLAQADAGRKLQLKPVDVVELVENVRRQAGVLAPDRDITWNQMTPTAQTAIANPDALRQVLLILMDNAIKHAQGPIHIEVDRDDERIAINVRDEGPGLPAEMQDCIFNRFYRGDASRSTPGFGLGLSIARSLTEAQHGTLEMSSQVDQGSTFTICLPLAH